MKIKTEYLVLAVVIIGLSVFLYFRKSDRVLYELPDTGTLKSGEIARIEIQAPGKTQLVLEKKDDAWRLASGAPAKPVDADEMAEAVAGLALTTLVSEKEDLARYDLSADKAVMVTAFAADGRKLRAIAIGKTASSQNHTFVRIDGDSRIYHARGRLADTLDKTAEELIDRRVLVFDRGAVTRITVEQGTETLTLGKGAKSEPGKKSPGAEPGALPALWTTSEGKAANAEAVERLLDELVRLECAEYQDPAGSKELGAPLCSLTLMDKKAHTLSLFAPDGTENTDYPARSSRSDLVFWVAADKGAEFLKSASDLAAGPDTSDKKE